MARLERVAIAQAARAVFQLLRGDHVDHIGSPNRKRGEAEAPPLSSSARGNRAAPIDRSQVGDSRRTRALPRYLAFSTKRHAFRLEHPHRRPSRGARSRIHAETGAAHFQRSLAANVRSEAHTSE